MLSHETNLDSELDNSRVYDTRDKDTIIHSIDWFQTNVRNYYKSNLVIGHLNINIVYNKLDEIKNLLSKKMFDILFLAETKVDQTTSNAYLNHSQYRLIRQGRKRGGGGILAYMREDFAVYRKQKLEPENVESICLEVKESNNARFIICACYRSPTKCKESDFISSLTNAVEMMYQEMNSNYTKAIWAC